ncbi:hypothetical protein RHGRI_032374 [Rhododendron griersonianum]|uniref:Uncharacterized protein n=1 Tax=Rhododendron griersonianum TaxID=479676 RepID=A0AAV6IC41_9ERIC|nr:hypothetical protein RHGRI_032374 [Rhododendron griersonianum]
MGRSLHCTWTTFLKGRTNSGSRAHLISSEWLRMHLFHGSEANVRGASLDLFGTTVTYLLAWLSHG